MVSVNTEIHRLLNKHIFIQKGLKSNIVNVRSLAKFLINEHSLNYSVDAVISAIRRYDLEEVSLLGLKEAKELFKRMSLSTKDNIARIVLRDRSFKIICEDFLTKKLLKENCRMIKSKETVALIVNQKELEKKLALFGERDVLMLQKDLSEIRLHFPKDISDVKGVVARVSAELATREINIEDVIFSVPDLLIYVKEENLVDAHKILMEIKKEG